MYEYVFSYPPWEVKPHVWEAKKKGNAFFFFVTFYLVHFSEQLLLPLWREKGNYIRKSSLKYAIRVEASDICVWENCSKITRITRWGWWLWSSIVLHPQMEQNFWMPKTLHDSCSDVSTAILLLLQLLKIYNIKQKSFCAICYIWISYSALVKFFFKQIQDLVILSWRGKKAAFKVQLIRRERFILHTSIFVYFWYIGYLSCLRSCFYFPEGFLNLLYIGEKVIYSTSML